MRISRSRRYIFGSRSSNDTRSAASMCHWAPEHIPGPVKDACDTITVPVENPTPSQSNRRDTAVPIAACSSLDFIQYSHPTIEEQPERISIPDAESRETPESSPGNAPTRAMLSLVTGLHKASSSSSWMDSRLVQDVGNTEDSYNHMTRTRSPRLSPGPAGLPNQHEISMQPPKPLPLNPGFVPLATPIDISSPDMMEPPLPITITDFSPETTLVSSDLGSTNPLAGEFTSAIHLEMGIQCHEAGSLVDSTNHFRMVSRAGLPDAMLLYALACRHGWGIRPDPAEALLWL